MKELIDIIDEAINDLKARREKKWYSHTIKVLENIKSKYLEEYKKQPLSDKKGNADSQ